MLTKLIVAFSVASVDFNYLWEIDFRGRLTYPPLDCRVSIAYLPDLEAGSW